MGLLEILNGIGGGGVANDPRTRSAPPSQGMSPMAKALLGLLAIYAMKNLRRADAPAAQPHRVERGRPAPSEPADEQEEAAERVEVRRGVEGEASLRLGGEVALRGGGCGVAELVHGDADDHGDHEGDEEQRIVP